MHIPVFNSSPATSRDSSNGRQGLGSHPTGIIGSLPFNAVQGSSASSSHFAVPASNSLAMLNANLGSFQNRESPAARQAQRTFMIDARRYIGNLLRSLMAPAADARAQSAIAQGLMHLNALSNGDLANLLWEQGHLLGCLRNLKTADLVALRSGVLGSPADCDAVLGQIPSSKLRHQASQALDQIKHSLDKRLATVFAKKSLKQIAKLLSCDPIDGQYLKESLIRLSRDMEALRQLSPGFRFILDFDGMEGAHECELHEMKMLILKTPVTHEPLLTLVDGSKREECLLALNMAEPDEAERARNMLDLIHEALLVVHGSLQEERPPFAFMTFGA